jgi:hypothetical protein
MVMVLLLMVGGRWPVFDEATVKERGCRSVPVALQSIATRCHELRSAALGLVRLVLGERSSRSEWTWLARSSVPASAPLM